MSGTKPKEGPQRPEEQATVEATPLFQESGYHKSPLAKVFVFLAVAIVVVMIILALAFCIYGAATYHQPRYFLLIINLILSAVVTGVLIFWYFRGVLVSSMLWYIFVQCFFFFFQCVTTDIFAFYENQTKIGPTQTPLLPPCDNNTRPCLPPRNTSQDATDYFLSF